MPLDAERPDGDDELPTLDPHDVLVDEGIRDIECRRWHRLDTQRLQALAALAGAVIPLGARNGEFNGNRYRRMGSACDRILEVIATETCRLLSTQPRSPLRHRS